VTALIAYGSDRVQDDYVNSSWWFEFLERHVKPEAGDLRRILDDDGSLVTGRSLEHLTHLREKLVVVASQEDQDY
jgi:hypothetical protein